MALAAIASLLVALLAWREFGAPEPAPAPGTSEEQPPRTDAPARPGARAERDLEALRGRYRAVLEARPFAPRSFRPRPAPAPLRPEAPAPSRPSAPPPPAGLRLRLTSLLGRGAGRHAVLEEGGTGRGIIVRAGARFADASVAEVATSSIVVRLGGLRKEIALGELLDLPAAARGSLVELRPRSAAAALPSPRGAGRGSAVELSDERRKALLERLRAARRASLQRKQGGQE
ncbi:MAG: hypothetical protein D6731_00255 [Planctomycetota bacterium]|nr:MAG: hypothetical protein D6731_00255 [Planctomycetota bacterium]